MYKNSDVWPDAFTRMGSYSQDLSASLFRHPHTRRRRRPNGRATAVFRFIDIDLERRDT